jgi:HAD superfamily hydrolase (TIGR01509 family)
MAAKKAFLFDLNGTMIDDMQYHIKAWYHILTSLGASLTMEQMKEECYGKNDELLERMFPGRFTDAQKKEMSLEKEKAYQLEYKPNLALIPGLHDFLKNSHAGGIPMAIGSAAIMFNIDFVLDNLNIRSYFDVIVCADDVVLSKPHPETYLACAKHLNMDPASCIVFEDSTKGVASAEHANMHSVVIKTLHEPAEFDEYKQVLMCIDDYTDPRVIELIG